MSNKRLSQLQEEARNASRRITQFEDMEKKAKETDLPMITGALQFLREHKEQLGKQIRRITGGE